GSGFRVQGSGFRVQGSGFRVQGSGFRVQGSGFRVQGSGFRVQAIYTYLVPERKPSNLHFSCQALFILPNFIQSYNQIFLKK
ncbi:MAG: hypothetical protein U9O82_13330, partial [Thermodesulfobacteriota bacterium]|nr:hypothetical protein [Thermodesulfobacteriota bacterium]